MRISETQRFVPDEEVRALAERAKQDDDEPIWMLLNEIMHVRARASGDKVLNVTTMVGTRGMRPIVVLNIGSTEVQMSSENAREHALVMLNAANAAETDAFLATYLSTTLKVDQAGVSGALRHFREYRAAREAEAVETQGQS